jgi:hypothetical protein
MMLYSAIPFVGYSLQTANYNPQPKIFIRTDDFTAPKTKSHERGFFCRTQTNASVYHAQILAHELA